MSSATSSFLYALIVGCEVAFWVVLLASLVARYVLRREVLSRALMYALPSIDLLLVATTALDLKAGAVATLAHGLAAVYVGFTLAFGTIAIRWADARFAFRFAAGPAPARAPRGWNAVRSDLVLWSRCIAAWLVALVLIEMLVAYVGDESATAPLRVWYRIATGGVFFWFLIGPAWSVVGVRRR